MPWGDHELALTALTGKGLASYILVLNDGVTEGAFQSRYRRPYHFAMILAHRHQLPLGYWSDGAFLAEKPQSGKRTSRDLASV